MGGFFSLLVFLVFRKTSPCFEKKKKLNHTLLIRYSIPNLEHLAEWFRKSASCYIMLEIVQVFIKWYRFREPGLQICNSPENVDISNLKWHVWMVSERHFTKNHRFGEMISSLKAKLCRKPHFIMFRDFFFYSRQL